jgi:hypothetical protein
VGVRASCAGLREGLREGSWEDGVGGDGVCEEFPCLPLPFTSVTKALVSHQTNISVYTASSDSTARPGAVCAPPGLQSGSNALRADVPLLGTGWPRDV